ncbi:LuxR family transcriptional regulator [Fulvimarina endophytica]|uniref:LuxR family transcriptional regulator n=1 Tax=Fulvimarina endophytica TaxID=2293836 RepID=A0A371WZ79_9HYPH|nr:LuxR family transcriptional regulator [Fulvimarina endophytica]
MIDPDLAADLLEARDSRLFAIRLLDIARRAAGIEELFACRLGDGLPEILASASTLDDVEDRAGAYVRRFHHSDPLAEARRATPPGQGFVRRIPAEAINLGAYRNLCFDRPRFAEKICFGWCRADDALVVSFYQRRDAGSPDMAQLGALAQLAMTGLSRLTQPPAPLLPELRDRLAQAYPALTVREREICARTLSGQTARAIADDLALGTSTVLTYRQRAYQKLGMRKSNDLLAAILH